MLEGTGAELYRTSSGAIRPGLLSPSELDRDIVGFTADSRSVAKGAFFFALKGERVDGHLFVSGALESGAAGAFVEKPWLEGLSIPTALPDNRLLLVSRSPLEALQRLASHWRQKHELTVVGVTGSIGKTTVKEATAQALSPMGETAVLKSTGNLNTEVGLPLELLRLNRQHRFAVLEMGMYQRGDIALLARIARPKIGIVTNVQANHMGRTGSLERTAQTKAELVHSLPDDGLAILNGDDMLVRLMGPSSLAATLLFGMSPRLDVSLAAVSSRGRAGFVAGIRHGARRMELSCRVPGTHNAVNLLPAVATAHHLGISWSDIQHALERLTVAGRLEYRPGLNGSTIIDDRYNASAPSVLAALDLLSREPGRRLALLGDMYELGAAEEEHHRAVGRVSGGLDFLILLGPRMRWAAEEARKAGLEADRIVSAESTSDAVSAAQAVLRPGDTMLIKGSRGLHLEDVVAELTYPEEKGG